MKRITGFPTRPNMVQQLLDVGFDYYNLPSSDGSHYWSDNVAYEFTLAEIDRIEDATNELHAMCMDFVADEIKQGDYAHYRFTDLQKNLIEQTWAKNVPHLYGRFDLVMTAKTSKCLNTMPTPLLLCLKLLLCNGNG